MNECLFCHNPSSEDAPLMEACSFRGEEDQAHRMHSKCIQTLLDNGMHMCPMNDNRPLKQIEAAVVTKDPSITEAAKKCFLCQIEETDDEPFIPACDWRGDDGEFHGCHPDCLEELENQGMHVCPIDKTLVTTTPKEKKLDAFPRIKNIYRNLKMASYKVQHVVVDQDIIARSRDTPERWLGLGALALATSAVSYGAILLLCQNDPECQDPNEQARSLFLCTASSLALPRAFVATTNLFRRIIFNCVKQDD